MIEHRKPDIVLVDKVQQKCLIIDVACPGDNRIAEKEEEKLQRYDLLKREIKRLWHMKSIDIIPIIVGALGSITTELGKRIEQLNIEIAIEKLQKTTLLGTARILLAEMMMLMSRNDTARNDNDNNNDNDNGNGNGDDDGDGDGDMAIAIWR